MGAEKKKLDGTHSPISFSLGKSLSQSEANLLPGGEKALGCPPAEDGRKCKTMDKKVLGQLKWAWMEEMVALLFLSWLPPSHAVLKALAC